MISVTQLRNGVTFEWEGEPYRVVKYEHTHLSRGGGTVRVRCRNLKTGARLNRAFQSTAYVQEIEVERKMLQFLYTDGDELVFMDPKTFDQSTLLKKALGTQAYFLKEGEVVGVFFWQKVVLDIDLPAKVSLRIVEAAPGVKGDSAANVYKAATLENGMTVKVPLFIKSGELVRVDTRTGEYVERANEPK